MNHLSTSTPFLGLGGSAGNRPPAGGSPLLSASAQDVAASFSELLRGNSAKAAPPQPAPQPVEPVQPPPKQQTPSPQAARPNANAQDQARAEQGASQTRETQARQTQVRSAEARSLQARANQARSEPGTNRNSDKAAAASPADKVDMADKAEVKQAAQTGDASAEAGAVAAQVGEAPTPPTETDDTAKLIALLAPHPASEPASPGTATVGKDDKAQPRGMSAGTPSKPGQKPGGEGIAGASAAALLAGGAAVGGDAASTQGLQSNTAQPQAQAAPGAAAPTSFEAVLGALQTQQSRAGADSAAPAHTGAAARLELAQPLHSPGFAPEMAARLSLLAADGVQQAQLHLNPAEMGPVSVQILVDGEQAQISFHSDQADTRAVLENSLPDLAAALRESGLTLSGGGVFQQARDPHAQAGTADRSAAGKSAPEGGEAELAAPPPPARASRGVLDLYA